MTDIHLNPNKYNDPKAFALRERLWKLQVNNPTGDRFTISTLEEFVNEERKRWVEDVGERLEEALNYVNGNPHCKDGRESQVWGMAVFECECAINRIFDEMI